MARAVASSTSGTAGTLRVLTKPFVFLAQADDPRMAKHTTCNQWKLEPTELAGYLIRHAETGLCLIPTTIGAEGRVYLDVGPFGHDSPSKRIATTASCSSPVPCLFQMRWPDFL